MFEHYPYSVKIISALARTKDPVAMKRLRQIAEEAVLKYAGKNNSQGKVEPANYIRSVAVSNLGLFGEDAIPYLKNTLNDPCKKESAIRGLGLPAAGVPFRY